MSSLVKYNISQWIHENYLKLLPPVCNKCLFEDQIKAFLVGGPNIRKDFHLEEGEEFFYMLNGDMTLRTVNHGKIEDILIREGYIYMQPGRVLHSPQRKGNTCGLVVERSRNEMEKDCLKYFINEENLAVEFERWFHMTDAVADLPPIISEYFEKIGKSKSNCFPTVTDTNLAQSPYEANTDLSLEKPLHLLTWIKENALTIKRSGSHVIYGAPKFKTTVTIYGQGEHFIEASSDGEIFIWFLIGNGTIKSELDREETDEWTAVETTIVPAGQQIKIFANKDSYFFTVCMPTPHLQLQ